MPEVSQEKVREQQRTAWGAAAPGWASRRESGAQRGEAVTEALLEMARIAPGQRVLDLASGVGDPAFAIADRVGPEGKVLGLDLTPEMVEAATAWAEEHGIQNVEFLQITSEIDLGVSEQSFDAATCRFGLMFMPDPTATVKALFEAVKPGGRLAIATWGPPERCPFFVFPNQILSRHVELPPPDPTGPGPFALSSREALEGALHGAGWQDVKVTAMTIYPVEADSPEEFWDLVCRTSGSAIVLMRSLPEERRQAIRDDALASLRGMMQDGKVRLSGEALVTSGVKPG